MDERSMQLRVGIVVISALLLTAILILLIGDFPTPFQQTKTLHINFPHAPGVTEGTPVRKSGILIGRVTKVEFREQAEGVQVTVKIRIGDGAQVYDNETFQVKGSLLGDSTLEVVPINESRPGERAAPDTTALEGDPGKTMFVYQPAQPPAGPPKPLPDGAVIEGRVVGNPLDLASDLEDDIRGTLNSVERAGDQVAQLAESVNELISSDDGRAGELVNKANLALDQFNQAMADINRLLGDEELEGDIRTTIQQMPLVMDQTQAALTDIQNMVARADKNLQNLEGLTGPLGEKGPIIAERVDASLTNLDALLAQLAIFSRKLNSNEGSFGELLNNPDMYHELYEAAQNINRVTAELQPIVNDVRVLSDKLARDPAQLGVRGALRPEARTKPTKDFIYPPPPTNWRQPLDEWPRQEAEWEVVP